MEALVNIADGSLEGEVLDNVLGGKYFSFKGIPYAAPPTGGLRFKAPQQLTPWSGVRSAKKHGTVFKQYDMVLKKIMDGSEDSLFVNVYSPDLHSAKPLPVMVWIHGGGFTSGHGDSSLYGPDFLVKKGVVLVTFNYRIGVLGFLSLDTEDIPGNAGMKDQVAALKWVNNNINSFGGDPNNVTIFGESAGGASVCFHLISPMSKGLFNRAIIQSGTCTNPWATAFERRERAIALARELGKDTEDDKELYEFFKSLPDEAFILKEPKITLAEKGQNLDKVFFSIVSEKQFGNNERFFYQDKFDILKNGIHEGVEVVIGYNPHEGVIGVDADANQTEINDYLEHFVPAHIRKEINIYSQLKIGRKFRDYYCSGTKVSLDNMMPIVKFISFDMFIFDILQLAKSCFKNNNKVYLYQFSCFTERNFLKTLFLGPEFMKNYEVISHADELSYIFNLAFVPCPNDKNSKSFTVIESMTSLWTNFAKHGNPTPDSSLGITWHPYTEDQIYLDINETLTLKKKPNSDELALWEETFATHLPKAIA